jgi:type II restriction/modification system DNA methylase subunit YeeA
MTPADFIQKWGDSTLRERQGAQEHFIDLCRLLGEPTPAEDDPFGERYCFERGAGKTGGGDGWADVWRRGCFGWEYKGKHKNLDAALRQLQAYALDLQNPPYLAVCDMERIVVHTNWTNTVSRRYEFGLDDLRVPARLDQLRAVFRGSESLKPSVSPQDLTAAAAARFGELGRRLQERDHPPRAVAHFLNRVIFCLFAEHAGLLPPKLFTRMIKAMQIRPRLARAQFEELFAKMGSGGFFGADVVLWFNGGLFDDTGALPLDYEDLKLIGESAAEHDWSQIDPAIFGTLFEEALKATRQRAALGAHYTDRAKILKIVEPVIVRPLTAEWDAAAAAIGAAMAEARAADEERRRVMERVAASLDASGAEAVLAGERGRAAATAENLELFENVGAARLPGAAGRAMKKAQPELVAIARRRLAAVDRARDLRDGFLSRLASFRVLDPACGSGNFLYVALHALRDIELRVLMDAARLGIPQVAPCVGLDALRGIEIEPYAAELARVTLWIGNLQWEKKNGYTAYAEPVLATLDAIENRDALVNPDGTEAEWPEADAIIGNPPFLGGKKLRTGLGDAAVERLFKAYKGRVPAEADFVCYWVERAWRAVGAPPPGETPFGGGRKAGLVTTNSIRGGASRKVLEPIAAAGALREAWADEPWVLEGAAVRVSMIGFGWGLAEHRLDGAEVAQINADLSAAGADLTRAKRLKENAAVAFMGDTKGGAFDIPGELARQWLKMPLNPNGRPNSDVLKPWRNAMDITRRSADKWIIDFGWTMSEQEAALYEAPFRHVLINVQPERKRNNRDLYRLNWWRHVESRQGLMRSIKPLTQFLITPRVATYRSFVFLGLSVLADSATIAIARDDDTTFGILHSRLHELWSLRMGTWLGVGNDPRYTPSTTFETFPFPEGLTPNVPAATYADDPRAKAIAAAAAELNRLRENWLNPPDLVRVEPEVVPGYPDRILPRDAEAAAVLKTRTLTNLYNARPAWLAMAHRRLDAAVAAAYGWPADLAGDAILERLFALNQERAAGR